MPGLQRLRKSNFVPLMVFSSSSMLFIVATLCRSLLRHKRALELWWTRVEVRWNLWRILKRVSVAVADFISFCATTKLTQCITLLMLLNNAFFDHSKRSSALPDSPPARTSLPEKAENVDFLKVVTNSQVSSLVKQYEESDCSTSGGLTASSGSGSRSRNYKHGNNGARKRSTGALKRLPCHICGNFGHWKSSQGEDGSLPEVIMSYETTAEYAAVVGHNFPYNENADRKNSGTRNSVTFNMESMQPSPSAISPALVPLVDDGAEYSGIGLIELKLFELNLHIDDLNPIPLSLTGVTH